MYLTISEKSCFCRAQCQQKWREHILVSSSYLHEDQEIKQRIEREIMKVNPVFTRHNNYYVMEHVRDKISSLVNYSDMPRIIIKLDKIFSNYNIRLTIWIQKQIRRYYSSDVTNPTKNEDSWRVEENSRIKGRAENFEKIEMWKPRSKEEEPRKPHLSTSIRGWDKKCWSL